MPEAQFEPVADLDALDALFERSHQAPVVLFLHAPHCPVGLMAYHAMRRFDGRAALVDVRTQHTLTRAIEERTGVRHESPQVLVLREGAAEWHASHYDISPEGVQEALGASASSPAGPA